MNHEPVAITVTSGKGGVGKTTTVASVGIGLAQLGRKVCLLDTDIGLRKLDSRMKLAKLAGNWRSGLNRGETQRAVGGIDLIGSCCRRCTSNTEQ